VADQTAQKKDMSSWRPGSEAGEAKNLKADGDFGVPAGSGPSLDRDYVSANTKRSDPGNAMPRSGEDDGGDAARESGAGANAGGAGSGSGGDLDPDFVGVAGGSGIAASAPGTRVGADASDGSSDEMASGGRAAGQNQNPDEVGKIGGSRTLNPGSVMNRADDGSTSPDGQGAAAATNPAARGDDSFAGEISFGEASGEDNAMSPSSDTQGLSQEDNQIDGQKDFTDRNP
jgi:hypothetical protein